MSNYAIFAFLFKMPSKRYAVAYDHSELRTNCGDVVFVTACFALIVEIYKMDQN